MPEQQTSPRAERASTESSDPVERVEATAPARRPRTLPGGEPLVPAVLQVLSVAYVAFVLAMTLLPIQWSHELSLYRNNWRPQLVPVSPLVSTVLFDPDRVTMIAESVGNVLMFVPLGCLLPLVVRWLNGWRRVLLVAFVTSVAIELYQLRMPGIRRADVNDVLANVLGAALGWLALVLVARRLARAGRPTPRQLAQLDPPDPPDHQERTPE
jgi:glycopeptide antibiotics resistance protein